MQNWITPIIPGWDNNLVYDYPYGASGNPESSVSGVKFVANCSLMREAASLQYDTTQGKFRFRLHDDIEEVYIAPSTYSTVHWPDLIILTRRLRSVPPNATDRISAIQNWKPASYSSLGDASATDRRSLDPRGSCSFERQRDSE